MNTKMIKSFFSTALKYIGIVIAMGILGIFILTLAYMIPVNQLTKNSSLSHQDAMGWAPLVNNRYSNYTSFFTSYEPGILDDTTDLIILQTALDESEGSALKRAAYMNDYGRYWHGYVAILRPVFYFIDYWDFLLMNNFLQLFVMGCVGFAIYRATGKKRYLFAFFSSCAFLTPAATAMSLQNTPVFYISMLGSFFCLQKTDWLLQKNRRYYLFLFLGIVTCYFDFLTYPLLSFAFPFCWFVVAAGNKLNPQSHFKLFFAGGLSFVFGYGSFFVTKWLLQVAICGKEILEDGFNNLSRHLNNLEDEYMLLHEHYNRLDSLYNNFRHYFYPLFMIIICIWIGVFVYNYLRNDLVLKLENAIYAAVTLTSPAWYFILNTHTACHHLFTYRIYSASLLGFMLFVCSSMGKNQKTSFSLPAFLPKAGILILCLGLGLCASRFSKEDMTSLNGGEHNEFLLTEGNILEFEFTPSIDTIKAFSFCIRTVSSLSGDIIINITDNDVVCATKTIPIAEYEETNYKLQLTDWSLDTGKQYRMKISIQDNADGICLLVTPEDLKPQTEYGKAYLNQELLTNIAPLSGIVYRGNTQTVFIKLYLSFCFGSFVLMWILSICAYRQNKPCLHN